MENESVFIGYLVIRRTGVWNVAHLVVLLPALSPIESTYECGPVQKQVNRLGTPVHSFSQNYHGTAASYITVCTI